jgi:hypothetical protein
MVFEVTVIILLLMILNRLVALDRNLFKKEFRMPSLLGFLGYVVTEHWIDILGVAVILGVFWYLKTH